MPPWFCHDTYLLLPIDLVMNVYKVSQTLLGNQTSTCFPTQFPSLTPENKSSPRLFIQGALWHVAGVLRRKALHELPKAHLE